MMRQATLIPLFIAILFSLAIGSISKADASGKYGCNGNIKCLGALLDEKQQRIEDLERQLDAARALGNEPHSVGSDAAPTGGTPKDGSINTGMCDCKRSFGGGPLMHRCQAQRWPSNHPQCRVPVDTP